MYIIQNWLFIDALLGISKKLTLHFYFTYTLKCLFTLVDKLNIPDTVKVLVAGLYFYSKKISKIAFLNRFIHYQKVINYIGGISNKVLRLYLK